MDNEHANESCSDEGRDRIQPQYADQCDRSRAHELRGALNAYDQVWKTGADTLARVPDVVATTFRDDLVSLEGQLTLIANVLAQGVADGAEETANRAANIASGAVDNFERVFDIRVMEAIDRIGVPSRELVRELAERIATLVRDIAEREALDSEQRVTQASRYRRQNPRRAFFPIARRALAGTPSALNETLGPKVSFRATTASCGDLRLARSLASHPMIETPRTASGGREVEENEAIQCGQLAAVDDRPETLGCVGDEVGKRHQARQNECNRPGEQAQQQ
jgi:hypothetical protein